MAGTMATSAQDRELSRQLSSNRNSVRNFARFSEHRRRLTQVVSERAPPRGARRLCVLGAGNCQDLELGLLLEHYAEIHLVDLDGEAITRARDQLPEPARGRLTLHPGIDLSQMLPAFENYRALRVAPEEIAEHPNVASQALLRTLGSTFDSVLSSCVLSQMQLALLTELGDTHRLFAALSYTLTLTHLKTLAALCSPGGRAIFATDAATEQMAPLAALAPDTDWLELLQRLALSQDVFSSLNPLLISEMLGDDPVLSRDLTVHPITDAWLWHNTEQRIYLVYAIVLQRTA